MSAGELIHRVKFQSPTDNNAQGSVTLDYADVATVMSKVTIITGRKGYEAFESGKPNARSFISVKLRFRDDVLATWRLVWEKQNYSIRMIDRSARRKGYLTVIAEAVGVT
jgi:SPP1 family predicted phage head-tail adaptor